MFGLTPEEMTSARRGRARAPRRVRLSRLLVWLLLGLLGSIPVAVLWTWNRPAEVQRWIDRLSGDAPFRLTIEEVVFLPVGSLTRPWSWKMAVTGLAFTPRDPKKPSWKVERGTMPLPQPRRVDGGRWWLHWTDLEVDGLVIEAHQQRPPPPWEPATPPVARLTVDRVRVRRARYSAPEDPPLGAARMVGIRGDLVDLVYDPGAREVSASGSLWAAGFESGNIFIEDIDAPMFRLDKSSLHFEGGFTFGGNPGELRGTIHTFHVKPRVAIRARLNGADVSDVVQTATGRESPVAGLLDLDLSVEAGGDRPRGCARMTGAVEWREGRIRLDPRTRYLVLDLIRVAPWVRLNAHQEIELSDAQGLVTLTRGTFTLRDLRYPAGNRPIRLDGTIASERLWLLVRLIPRVAPEDRLGLAVAVEGGRQAQKVRLATRGDVFRARPWLPPEWDGASADLEGLPCGLITVD